jgi:glycosyltransferase EpsD
MLAGLLCRLAVIISCIFDKDIRKTKIIHTCHGYLFNDKGLKSKIIAFIEKILSVKTDCLFVMNSDDYNIALKYKLCKKIKYINGIGIDIEKLKSFPGNNNHINYKDKLYFLCVGEFSKRKNQRNIICAFSDFIKSLPDKNILYHLVFLGDGALAKECKELCVKLGINDYVTFGGHVNKTFTLYKYYKSAYCVVSASKFEGLPFNIMEALYYGIPVIASNVKGHKDLISDGFNGFLFEYDDNFMLTELFKKILNSDIYNKLKENVFLDEKYYLKNVKEKVLEEYNI